VASEICAFVRAEKAVGHTAVMYAYRRSDRVIVPEKLPNNRHTAKRHGRQGLVVFFLVKKTNRVSAERKTHNKGENVSRR